MLLVVAPAREALDRACEVLGESAPGRVLLDRRDLDYLRVFASRPAVVGRTLADLILRRETDLVRLPFVGHRSRNWEPEPLRWIGVNAGLRLLSAGDAEERLTGRQSILASTFWRLFAREPG